MPVIATQDVTVLVPCGTTREHADLRPHECPVCHGTHLRPARDAEVVSCVHGHESELLITDDGPELDGWAPDREDVPWRGEDGAMLWWCRTPDCDDSIILNTRPA